MEDRGTVAGYAAQNPFLPALARGRVLVGAAGDADVKDLPGMASDGRDACRQT